MKSIHRQPRWAASIVAASVLLIALGPSARSATGSAIHVDTTADSVAVDGACSLREAVLAANAGRPMDTCAGHPGLNVIELKPGRYALSIAGGDEDAGLTGDLDVASSVTIRGAGSAATIIDANGIDRAIQVANGAQLRLVGVKVLNGNTETGCCGSPSDAGGGIRSSGTLTVIDTVLADSHSGTGGGGIASDGSLTLRRTTVRDNSANGSGGGVAATGPTDIRDSTIVGNRASGEFSVKPYRDDPGSAAGIDSRQPLTLVRSLVARNQGFGEWAVGGVTMRGGLILESTIRANTGGGCGSGGVSMIWGLIDRSTVSGNRAGDCDGAGGVVAIDSQIRNSTISGNRAGSSYYPGGSMQVGGVLSDVSTIIGSTITRNVNRSSVGDGPGPGGLLAVHLSPPAFEGNLAAIRDTIIAGNRYATAAWSDCQGTITSDGHNLVGSTAGCDLQSRANDLVGVRPNLAPLAANGGPTLTHQPLPGSPAIDAWAPDAHDTDCPLRDQRGFVRPTDGNADGVVGCDIGAVEAAP